MPYKIKGKCIYKKDTGKKVGCTTGSVEKYMNALHANIKESFDDAILHYLSEMDNTQGTLGATTTGKFTSTTAPVAPSSTPQVNVDLSTLDDKNIAHIKDVCMKMGKPYNSNTHNEVALAIQNAKKQKTSKLQPAPTTNLVQPVQQQQQPAAASAAPSTTYSSQPAI